MADDLMGNAAMNGWSALAWPNACVRTMESRSRRAAYEIRVWCPPGISGSEPLPAVYVLDGENLFGTFADAVARTSRRPDATNVGPALVVAICRAPTEGSDVDRRHADYTPGPAAEGAESLRPTGGAAEFLQFIETELVPVVERDFPADPSRRTLFGHSLAGFFTLYALTTRPDSFAAFVAVSPSIWWDEPRLRAGLERLEPHASHAPRVLIGVGEWEGELPPWQRQRPEAARIGARRAGRAMIDRARRFAMDLGRVVGSGNVAFYLFPDEDHASVVLIAVARALRFGLGERVEDDRRAEPGPGSSNDRRHLKG